MSTSGPNFRAAKTWRDVIAGSLRVSLATKSSTPRCPLAAQAMIDNKRMPGQGVSGVMVRQDCLSNNQCHRIPDICEWQAVRSAAAHCAQHAMHLSMPRVCLDQSRPIMHLLQVFSLHC